MTTQSFAEKHILVAGIAGGREVFLGKALDEPLSEQMTIEGKALCLTPQGFLGAKPFTTLVQFPLRDATCQIQQIANPEAKAECDKILNTSMVHFPRAAFPLIHRWVESSIRQETPALPADGLRASRNGFGSINTYLALHDGFISTAEQFHRVLFQLPQVASPRELDRLSELKGNLTIEMDKITNQIGVKFNNLVVNEPQLTNYFEAVEGAVMHMRPTHILGIWMYLMNRFEVAKSWARSHGKTMLIREINALAKEGIIGVNEVVLDSCSALDTLITEASSQYGITSEAFGELSPFAGLTTTYRRALETTEAPTPAPIGASI